MTDSNQEKAMARHEVAGRDPAELSEDDLYLFNEGTHRKLADKLGAHPRPGGGTFFAVWAPNATGVSVVGDFNYWDRATSPLASWRVRDLAGPHRLSQTGRHLQLRDNHSPRRAAGEG